MRQGCRATCGSFCRLALGSRVPASCALLRAVVCVGARCGKVGQCGSPPLVSGDAYFFFAFFAFFAAFFAFFAIWPPEGPGSA